MTQKYNESLSFPPLGTHDPDAANVGVNFYTSRGVELKPIKAHIPATFDAARFVQAHKKLHAKHRTVDADLLTQKAVYFLNRISRLKVYRRHSDEEFVNIHSDRIREFLGPGYARPIVETLERTGIIECDNVFVIDIKPLGYRIAPKHQGKMRTELITNPVLLHKMYQHRLGYGSLQAAGPEKELVRQHLATWLSQIRIDAETAKKLNREQAEATYAAEIGLKPKKRTFADRRALEYAIACNDAVIDELDEIKTDGVLPECKYCPQGRIHSLLTRLFTAGRSCLSLAGESLATVDISNSQVIFFTIMLQESLHLTKAEELRSQQDTPPVDTGWDDDEPAGPASPPSSFNISAVPLVVNRKAGFQASTERFIEMAFGGTVYDFLMVRYDEERNDGKQISRSEFKPQFFKQVLYNDSNAVYAKNLKLARLFADEFPEVWQFVLKSKEGDGPEAWKLLSLMMQKRESTFMYDRVVSRLMKHHAHIPVFTIHDSIMTTPEHMPTVYRIMTEEFNRMSINPKLRVEGLVLSTADTTEARYAI